MLILIRVAFLPIATLIIYVFCGHATIILLLVNFIDIFCTMFLVFSGIYHLDVS